MKLPGAKIKENLKDLMKLPGYTLTYGIGGKSGLMKSEVFKEKSKKFYTKLMGKNFRIC